MKDIISRFITKRAVVISAFVFILFIGLMIAFGNRNKAYGNSDWEKKFVSIQIHEGDTLWDIAEAYYTSECVSIRDYVKEIKRTNGLKSDCIHAGNYLLIPYYSKSE